MAAQRGTPSKSLRHANQRLESRAFADIDDRWAWLAAKCEQILPRRFGLIATAAIMLGSLGLGIVKGGHVDQVVSAFQDARDTVANAAGFRITSLAISGRKQLSQDQILAIGGVTGHSSLLFLDAAAVRDRLKANPWIADATVFKLYPDRLQISVTERVPVALWQKDGKLSVISQDGAVLENFVAPRFTSLPLVVGVGAETRARDFLALLSQYKDIQSVTRAAVLVGERRWNLRLNNGLDVRLPETDVAGALQLLTRLDRDDHLLSRDITAVDLRLPDRVTVRLSEQAAQARADALKAQAKKAKAAGSA
jgi:cell division protein FtsQ